MQLLNNKYKYKGFTLWNTRVANSTGFTLIELLVVIAIIGVLSTLAVYSTNIARQRSRDTKRITDISQVQTALELYFADQQGYPVVATPPLVLGGTSAKTLSGAGFTATGSASGTTYMGQVPANLTPGGADYQYRSTTSAGAACPSGKCASYVINFTLEDITGRLLAGVHTANPSGIE